MLKIIYEVCLKIFSNTLKNVVPFTAVYFLATLLYKNLGWEYYLSTMGVVVIVLTVTFQIGRRIRRYLTGKDDTTHGDVD